MMEHLTALDKCARFDVTDRRRFATLLQWLNRPISGTWPVTVDDSGKPAATTAPFPGPLSPLDSSGFLDLREAFWAYERLWSAGNRRRILLLEAEGEHGKSDLMTRFFAHSQNGLPGSSTAFLRLSPPVRELHGACDLQLEFFVWRESVVVIGQAFVVLDMFGFGECLSAAAHRFKFRKLDSCHASEPTFSQSLSWSLHSFVMQISHELCQTTIKNS